MGTQKNKQKNVPTRSDFTGITTFVGTFGAHNVGNTKYFEYHSNTKYHFLSPYTNPTPKPTTHRNHSAFEIFKNIILYDL